LTEEENAALLRIEPDPITTVAAVYDPDDTATCEIAGVIDRRHRDLID